MQTLLFVDWKVNPEIFSIGGFALRYYSVMFVLAFGCSYYIMDYIFKRENASLDLLSKLFIYVFLGTLIGARLGHALFYEFGYFKNHLLEIILPFKFPNGSFEWTGYRGLASHGGAIGILTAVFLYCKKYKQSFLWTIDRLVIVIALAGFFIRIGNLFNSEIIGTPTSVPWAFIFYNVDAIPRHPAQLYEALLNLITFLVLWLIYKRNTKSCTSGFLFGCFLVLVFTSRFIVEFVKENQEAFENNWLINLGQLLSIPFILFGLYLMIVKFKKEVQG